MADDPPQAQLREQVRELERRLEDTREELAGVKSDLPTVKEATGLDSPVGRRQALAAMLLGGGAAAGALGAVSEPAQADAVAADVGTKADPWQKVWAHAIESGDGADALGFDDAVAFDHEAVSSATTIGNVTYIYYDSSVAGFTITIPASLEANGVVLRFVDQGGSAGSNSVTIDSTNWNIDGSATISIGASDTVFELHSAGDRWLSASYFPSLVTEDLDTDEHSSKNFPVRDVTHPDYGAVGDGSTDDFDAIDAAISDAAGDDGSSIVYFPDINNGTTYIVGTERAISGVSDVILMGPGREKVTVKVKAGSGVSRPFNITGSTRIRFQGLTIDGSDVAASCINVFDAMTDLELFDVRLETAGNGLAHNASGEDWTGFYTRDLVVSDITAEGIALDGNLTDAYIRVESDPGTVGDRILDLKGPQLGEGRNENIDVEVTARTVDNGVNGARIEGVDGGSVRAHLTSPENEQANGGSGDQLAIRDCKQFVVRPGTRIDVSGDQGILINGGKSIQVFGHVQKCDINGVMVTTAGSTGSFDNPTPTDVTIMVTSRNNNQNYASNSQDGSGILINQGQDIVVVGSHAYDDQGTTSQDRGVEVNGSNVTASDVEILATRAYGNGTSDFDVPEGTPVNGQAFTSGTADTPSGSAVPNRTLFRYDDTDDDTGDGVYFKDDAGTIHGPL